jgi:urease accessory protein
MTTSDIQGRDPAWSEPAQVPDEVRAFDQTVAESLPVGAPGKVGAIDLTLTSDGARTRVERQFQRAPLHVYRPLYLDAELPGMAFIYLQQSGDGLVQGDRNRVDVHCGPGSEAHLTTQAATKIFTTRQNFASQIVNLRVENDAFVEYLPDPVVPFRGSRFFQHTTVMAHSSSTVIIGETLLPGRVAYGESHVYDLYWSETEVQDQTGEVLVKDLLRLQPGAGGGPHSLAVLGQYEVIAAFYIITKRASPTTMTEVLRAALDGRPQVLAGVTELPNECGVGVRLLGTTSAAVRTGLTAAWAAARLHLLGAPLPDLRKG